VTSSKRASTRSKDGKMPKNIQLLNKKKFEQKKMFE